MDVFIKKATEQKREKQELLNEMETLKQKIDKLDGQLRLLKENLDTYVRPQAEADNIVDIPSNVVDNAVNNNLEGIEEELGMVVVAAVLLRTTMGSSNFMWTYWLEHCQNLVPEIIWIQTS